MSHEEIIEILRMSDLFCELSDDELHAIAKLCQIEGFKAGEIIYHQNSIGTKLYILASG